MSKENVAELSNTEVSSDGKTKFKHWEINMKIKSKPCCRLNGIKEIRLE